MPTPVRGEIACSPMRMRPNPIVLSALASAIMPAAKPKAAAGKLTRGVRNCGQNCSTIASTPNNKIGQPPEVAGPNTRTTG